MGLYQVRANQTDYRCTEVQIEPCGHPQPQWGWNAMLGSAVPMALRLRGIVEPLGVAEVLLPIYEGEGFSVYMEGEGDDS